MSSCSCMVKLEGKDLKNKKSLVLSKIQREIIVGILLGDSIIEFRENKPVYALKLEQKIEQKEYIENIYSYFSDWCEMEPKTRNVNGVEDKNYIWFRTYTHISFKFYYDIFYNFVSGKRVKVVPKIIHRLLTARSLAHWFMDKGDFYSDNNKNKSYLFNTQEFRLHEQKILVLALKNKFNLIVDIRKNKDKYRLCVTANSNLKFLEIVKPFILPSMLYKLGCI